MLVSITIICILFLSFMCVYIVLGHHDWYLFLFPLFVLSVICAVLSLVSDALSIAFSILIAGYVIYNLTNKRARQISKEIKLERARMCEQYKREEVNDKTTFKDYILPNGSKIEYIDFNTKTFYLLRPYTDDIEKKYKKQIQKYVKELEKAYGGDWSYVIDTY